LSIEEEIIIKFKKNIIKIVAILTLLISIITILVPYTSKATNTNEIFEIEDLQIDMDEYSDSNIQTRQIESSDLQNREFYIKNMYSGQYLDVAGGVAADGTNVQQYKFNGTDSQRWRIASNGDGTLTIYSRVGAVGEYKYALDISNASGDNYANVQIWTPNGTDAQKFKMGRTELSTVAFFSKVSGYSKAIVLNGPTCDQGRNIDQYTFQSYVNEMWILEPVSKYSKLGVDYAKANWNKSVACYPNYMPYGVDCTNFASQCMLASGIHYQDDWYMYRKNSTYNSPNGATEINTSWELGDPSPWQSAKYFGRYWNKKVKIYVVKGTDIINNPNMAWFSDIGIGDVVQYADNNLGFRGEEQHTMYIRDARVYEGHNNYVLTYHSKEVEEKDLLQVVKENPNYYYVFYKMI